LEPFGQFGYLHDQPAARIGLARFRVQNAWEIFRVKRGFDKKDIVSVFWNLQDTYNFFQLNAFDRDSNNSIDSKII
jgi:hypothetical protein